VIGYWIVVVMVGLALIAVLVAAAAEGTRPRAGSTGPGRIVWAVLGASDATGEGLANPATENWVAQLHAGLPPDVTVVNLGESGSTLADARRHQLPAALAVRPDVVTFWLVVNDLVSGVPLPEYERDLAAVLTDLSAIDCEVVVGNVPDLTRVPALLGSPDHAEMLHQAVITWNAAIARIAAAHGADVIDLFDDALSREDVGPDGFHPSARGHARLADRFRPAVERAIGRARAHTPQSGGDR
jgi:acyl-CoA thioesterase-1